MESQNVTRSRWYDDACGTALAMELVGERWSLLIVRELMYGGRRFGELRSGLPGISANVLTQRLEGLEQAGILVRRRLPPPASVQVYELTPWGRESEPAIQALGRWAARSPLHDPTLFLSGASLMMSMRTMLVSAKMRGLTATVGVRLGAEAFTARLAYGELRVVRGAPERPDLTIEAETAFPIVAWIYGKQPPAPFEADGSLRFTGDRSLAMRFATLFELPPKVA